MESFDQELSKVVLILVCGEVWVAYLALLYALWNAKETLRRLLGDVPARDRVRRWMPMGEYQSSREAISRLRHMFKSIRVIVEDILAAVMADHLRVTSGEFSVTSNTRSTFYLADAGGLYRCCLVIAN